MIRICAVQLDFVPSAIIPGSQLWAHAEPLSWGDSSLEVEFSLSRLAEGREPFEKLRQQIELRVVEFQNRRLQQVLSFLERNSVDICVLPEYALTSHPSTLKILAGFAPKMTIVAGLGIARSAHVKELSVYSSDAVVQNNNIVGVFSRDKTHIICKAHPAEKEELEPGLGPRTVAVEINGRTVNVGVAICRDYLVDGPVMSKLDPMPDIIAIPAYSQNTNAFAPDLPRDYPRVFSNAGRWGGSTIFAAGCTGPYVAEGIVKSVPAGSEGLVAIDWHGPPQKPTSLIKEDNRLALRSAIVVGAKATKVGDILRTFSQITQVKGIAKGASTEVSRWIEYCATERQFSLVADSLQQYRRIIADDTMSQQLSDLLTQHLVTAETMNLEDFRSGVLDDIVKEIQSSLQVDDDSAGAVSLFKAGPAYFEARGHRSPRASGRNHSTTERKAVCHFSIGLGSFDRKDAVATLSDQQAFLNAFAKSAPPNSRITYRLDTIEDPATGNVFAQFSLDFFGSDEEEVALYFASLERIARPLFVRGWNLYSGEERARAGRIAQIVPSTGVSPRPDADLSLLVDVLRSTGGECSIELHAAPATVSMTSPSATFDSSDSQQSATGLESHPLGEQLGVAITVTTPKDNLALPHLVGSLLLSGPYTITNINESGAPSYQRYPVEVAHRVLHPPHGYIEGRGSSSTRTLDIAIPDRAAVVVEGAHIGVARAARPFADDTTEVRIPDSSRLLHTYVIGRTGAGKSNTLKNIIRHDLSRSGPVIVVDPHGDVFDYALRHATERETFLALDFSNENVPSVNPIYLDARNEDDISRNINELIELIQETNYFEWAGPRFSDILELALETLVATSDEKAGDWASICDVITLIENDGFRRSRIDRLQELGRHDLKRRWMRHHRIKPEERAELEQWFISKFSVFRTNKRLQSALSGQPSIALRDSLTSGAAILMRVPQVALGSGASYFLGSLIVSRVLRCALDGVFVHAHEPATLVVDEFQHFVTTSFSRLIPEARKFNLGITVANQTLSQLGGFSLHEGRSSDSLAQILLGNVGNLIVQGVGVHDAEVMAPELGVTARDLQRIGKHAGVVLLTVDGERLPAFSVEFNDSRESPGATAESVAWDLAQRHLVLAAEKVALPTVRRIPAPTVNSDLAVENTDDVPPVAPSSGGGRSQSSGLLEGWLEARKKPSSATKREVADERSGGDRP